MESITLTCNDCGGTGIDPGSLYQPEDCNWCYGGGVVDVELDPRSSQYGVRKPMGREVIPVMTVADFEAPGWLTGER